MINSIGSGPNNGYLQVNGGYSNNPYVSPNANNPMQGMIRLNGSGMEVFDGSSWISMGYQTAEVSLSGMAISALDWATKKMHEEQRMQELAKRHPGVADAVANLEKAMYQVKVMVALTEQEEKAL